MHVAIIMNGNSRYALRRPADHSKGVAALQTTVRLAAYAGIKTLTLYAICAPECAPADSEIDANLRVLGSYLSTGIQRYEGEPVRISLIGKREPLGTHLLRAIERRARPSAPRTRMHLRIVIDYSAHDSVVQSSWCSAHPRAPETFAERLREIDDTALPAGAVDLLIRTGGGKCRSDFLLWEVAYARLHYADCLWPDFTARDFQRALAYYGSCDRLGVKVS